MKMLIAIFSLLLHVNFQNGLMSGSQDPEYQKRCPTGENGMDTKPIAYYKGIPITISSHQIENPQNYNTGNTTATGIQIWGW